MSFRCWLGGVSLVMAAAVACGGATVGVNGSCPCTVGNSGLEFTLACGASTCSDLNGVSTGYSCTQDGLKPDPTACASPGRDAGLITIVEAGAKDASHADGTIASRDAGSGDSGSLVDSAAGDAHADAGDASSRDAHLGSTDASGIEGGCISTSDAGECFSGLSCGCNSQCSFACGAAADAGPSISCVQAGTCDVGCAGNCQVDCTQSASCSVTAGAGANLGCIQSPSCTATLGASSMVNCTQAGTCSVTVGANSTVNCTQATDCEVTCPGGCEVNCEQATACTVACGAGQSCVVDCEGEETLCPGGTTVCGTAVCPM